MSELPHQSVASETDHFHGPAFGVLHKVSSAQVEVFRAKPIQTVFKKRKAGRPFIKERASGSMPVRALRWRTGGEGHQQELPSKSLGL